MRRLIARTTLACLLLTGIAPGCGDDPAGGTSGGGDIHAPDTDDSDISPETGEPDGDTGDGDVPSSDVDPDTGQSELCTAKLDPDAHCASTVDLEPCDDVACSDEGECIVTTTPAPACCASDEDCDDADPLSFTWCPGGGQACMNQPDPLACPDGAVLLSTDFNDGTLQGWILEDTDGDPTVGWHITSRRTHSGVFAAGFGRSDCPTYYGGPLNLDCALDGAPATTAGHQGSLLSKLITLPAEQPAVLTMQVFAEMELTTDPSIPCATNPINPSCFAPEVESQFDSFGVEVLWDEIGEDGSLEAHSDPAWSIQDMVNAATPGIKSTGGGFHHVVFDLSPWQGKTIRLRVDGRSDGNDAALFEGATLDSVFIRTYCDSQACVDDDDCGSPNPCLDHSCTSFNTGGVSGLCLQEPVSEDCIPCPGLNSASCEDGDPCTTGVCASDAVCQQQTNGSCCEESLLGELITFESGNLPVGWETSGGVGAVGWNVTTIGPADGTHHLYFGNPVSGHYDAGSRVLGSIRTGFMHLPQNSLNVTANMALKLATQYEQGAHLPGQLPYDRFTIGVVELLAGAEIETLLFDSLEPPLLGSTGDHSGVGSADYANLGLDLSAWRGRTVRLAFTFDSWDEGNNVYAGVFIDNFAIQVGCEPPQCTSSEFCNDGDGCTSDTCAGSYCTFIAPDSLCCEADASCDDNNACTTDDCKNGQCLFAPVDDASCCAPTSTVLAGFEGENAGWKMLPPGAAVGWTILNNPLAYAGSAALHHGDPIQGTYGGSEAESDPTYAVSPDFLVPAQGNPELRFWMKATTPDPADALDLLVLPKTGEPVVVWSAVMGAFTTVGDPVEQAADLSNWSGQILSLGFRFTTAPKTAPLPGAIWIDQLTLQTTCETNP
jgi:hypothetical protein